VLSNLPESRATSARLLGLLVRRDSGSATLARVGSKRRVPGLPKLSEVRESRMPDVYCQVIQSWDAFNESVREMASEPSEVRR
jgi:hypothetical protein